MISTLRWVRKITFLFIFFGFAPKFSRLDSSLLKTRNLLGVFVRNNIFLRGVGPTSVFYMGRSRGAWDPTRTRNVHKTVLRREKGISPPKCGFSQNQKDKKKHNHHQHLNNGSGQSRIETGARTNSTPTPAPTDDRQLAVRYRYRDGLEVPHIVSLSEPLDLALIRIAAALEQNPAG